MNLGELLRSDRPPKKDEITDEDLTKLFIKYKGLLKQIERDKAFSAATHENIRIAYAKLDELVKARTDELRKANEQLQQEVTKHRKAENELKKHREHLEELVKERTKKLKDSQLSLSYLLEDVNESREELQKVNKQLESANKELEAFSYSVSHDLRAPLRAIDGFSKVILEDYEDKLDSEGNEYLQIIRKNTQLMGELISDLLEFSHLGRKSISYSKMNTLSIVKSTFGDLMEINAQRKIEFKIKKLIDIQVDKSMIKQVFFNLLSNAIKFTEPKEKVVIEIGSKLKENEIIFYVKDNGVGFDMKYKDKLFGVFQRLHSATEFEGTGVGLALVQRIITKHEGRVWAEGKVDEGATFYFSLPVGK